MQLDDLKILLKKISIPPVDIKISRENGVLKILDPFRKKKIILTPEETVRQIFTLWLKDHLGYPASLISNEVGINLNGTKKRCDTVIFNSEGQPLMIIEYKSPDISVSQEVFDQIIRYNSLLRASFLVVSNGISHFCCKMDYEEHNHIFLKDIPSYNQIKNLK